MISRAMASGSSPLTRGARVSHREILAVGGLIPAHAGSTRVSPVGPQMVGAHPRSRGEHILVAVSTSAACGSSPLTRGAQQWPRDWWRVPGLIPAHAGSTESCVASQQAKRAHPRSRGEHVAGRNQCSFGVGSSPLTRGAQNCR